MAIQAFDELSEVDIDRAERLVNAATAGPWISYVVGRDPEADSSYIELGTCNELGSLHSLVLVGGSVADQDFIASAREDVQRLVLEVRMLRARLRALVTDKGRAKLHNIVDNVEKLWTPS
ncbi:MAG: hypothetical protein ABW110_20435 [Steroidobacteraceae bacterium]